MADETADETVLVTGGSGFLGSWCVVHLLRAGYRVRTTVRSAAREEDVRAAVRAAGVEPGEALGFAVADLTTDGGWAAAADGCAYVLHVASPFPLGVPRDENELIAPARDGTLRVLRAARAAGVRRVVLTSSIAAIGYGHRTPPAAFTEKHWTDLDGPHVPPYPRSKTLAERAAWDFAGSGGPELAVVNPGGILGPVLGPASTSIEVVERLLRRGMPALPRLSLNLVDVRDVADLHLRAMTSPRAAGERFVATAGDPVWLADIARLLRDRLGPAGARVPTRTMPDLLVRLAALADPALRGFVHELGVAKRFGSDKARTVLGWRPRTSAEAVLATAESLLTRDRTSDHQRLRHQLSA